MGVSQLGMMLRDLALELIFVDDGSRDATLARLAEIEAADPRVRVLRLRRNFGQTAAFSAGKRQLLQLHKLGCSFPGVHQ